MILFSYLRRRVVVVGGAQKLPLLRPHCRFLGTRGWGTRKTFDSFLSSGKKHFCLFSLFVSITWEGQKSIPRKTQTHFKKTQGFGLNPWWSCVLFCSVFFVCGRLRSAADSHCQWHHLSLAFTLFCPSKALLFSDSAKIHFALSLPHMSSAE